MLSFLAAGLWGLAVLAALAGWGRLPARLLQRAPDAAAGAAAGWLEAPAWGIAVSSVLGGLLNLAGLANRVGALAYVLIGLGIFLFEAARRWRDGAATGAPWRRSEKILLAVVVLLLGVRFAGSVVVVSFHTDPGWKDFRFNPQDDMQSYLVSIERLLQTGTLGPDPFNSRLMMTGLGAEHFLNALVACALPLDNWHLLEGGIGLAAFCLAGAGLARRCGLGRNAATALMLVPLALDCQYINLTSAQTAAAVFTALISWHAQPRAKTAGRFWTRVLMAGLLLAGACSLKSTLIPPAVLFVVFFAVLAALLERTPAPLGEAMLAGFVALAVMTPWMVWQHGQSGTFLYPLLGRGDHYETYFPATPETLTETARQILAVGLVLPVALLAFSLLLLAWGPARRAAGAALAAATLAWLQAWTADWPALVYSTEIPSVARYAGPAHAAGLMIFLVLVWRTGGQLARAPGLMRARFAGPAMLAAVLVSLAPVWLITGGLILPRDLSAGLRGEFQDWAPAAAQARALQAAVPPEEKLLAYLDAPFLLDFRRNQVFVADWPGESSPPPGLPVRAGGEAVAGYLRGQGIRYVAYAYRDSANFPRGKFENYVYFDYGHVIHRQAKNAFAFQDDLAQLARTRQKIYDDGAVCVLDLEKPTPPAPRPLTGPRGGS